MLRVYISAIGQDAGKTTTSLGLFQALQQAGQRVGFIKPVGQHYVECEGVSVDEDVLLFRDYLNCELPLEAMSAVTIPKGFTEEYIFNRNKARIYDAIDAAFAQIDTTCDVTVIEGTGHAGVGSVFDASNAVVAKLLGAKTILVAGGGIGRCLDQVALNHALFRQEGVELLGVIVNKVFPEKYEKINRVVRQGLANMGIECLGVVPYLEELTFPMLEQICEDLHLDLADVDASQRMRHVRHKAIAGVEPQAFVRDVKPGTLLVAPAGCVESLLVPGLKALRDQSRGDEVVCVIFADGYSPSGPVVSLLASMEIPAVCTGRDSLTIAQAAGELVVKISPRDPNKVQAACDWIREHIDLDRILAAAAEE
jgi:dethiobiotin synthetase